jgi:hypothetical protein
MTSFRETPALGVMLAAGIVALVTAYSASREAIFQTVGQQATATVTNAHDTYRSGRRSYSRRYVTVIDYTFTDAAGRTRKDWSETRHGVGRGSQVPVVYAPWADGPSRPADRTNGKVSAVICGIAVVVAVVAGVVFWRRFYDEERRIKRRSQAWAARD